ATRTPLASRQLACRAEFALHAVVGLDPAARIKAEQLLLSRLTAPDTPQEQRMDLATAVANWGPVSHALTVEAARTLIDAMIRATDQSALRQLAWKLDAVAQHLTPEQAAPVARLFTEAMTKTADDTAVQELAGALVEVAQKLPPETAAQILTDAT